VEVVEVEGGVAILLSEHSGNRGILESVVEEGPLVTKSDHILDAFLTLLLERYGGGDLRGGVRYRYTVQTGYHLLFLRRE